MHTICQNAWYVEASPFATPSSHRKGQEVREAWTIVILYTGMILISYDTGYAVLALPLSNSAWYSFESKLCLLGHLLREVNDLTGQTCTKMLAMKEQLDIFHFLFKLF